MAVKYSCILFLVLGQPSIVTNNFTAVHHVKASTPSFNNCNLRPYFYIGHSCKCYLQFYSCTLCHATLGEHPITLKASVQVCLIMVVNYSCIFLLVLAQAPMEQNALKDVNNCLNTNIYFYLETSGGQTYNQYLNVVQFFQHQC
jgi:hypothetical protein